jgi:hypothetical protein
MKNQKFIFDGAQEAESGDIDRLGGAESGLASIQVVVKYAQSKARKREAKTTETLGKWHLTPLLESCFRKSGQILYKYNLKETYYCIYRESDHFSENRISKGG